MARQDRYRAMLQELGADTFALLKPDGRTYVGADCKLDGQDATICGRLNDFATVATLPNGPHYDFAWSTVARIMAAGGEFKS